MSTEHESRLLRLQPYLFGFLTGMVLGLVGLLLLVRDPRLGDEPPAPEAFVSEQDPDEMLRQSRSNAIVNAVEMTRRSVVTISAAGHRLVRSPLRDLFTWPSRRQRVVSMQWIGSGFLLDHDGHIMTNEHVVRGAENVVVSLGDGTSTRANLVGASTRFDLALLRIEHPREMTLTPATLGSSDDIMVGEWAIAIGSPFGDALDDPQPSVSVGVISAIDRHIRPPPDYDGGSWPYVGLLQTDAAINSGNSGGPLVNSNGEVVGVNMSRLSRTSVGVNFSIPINTAKWVADELRDYGEVRKTWVGWRLDEAIPAAARRAIHLAEEDGVLVVGAVDAESPAAHAGVETGDVVLSINGQDPYSRSRADRILVGVRVGGDPIEVQLLRPHNGQRLVVMLDVLENPVTRAERLRRRGRRLG
jgi:serine protease Do